VKLPSTWKHATSELETSCRVAEMGESDTNKDKSSTHFAVTGGLKQT
jgi:hypothetical protein